MKKFAVFSNLPSGGAKRSLYEYLKRLSVKYEIDLYRIKNPDDEFLSLDKFAKNVFIYEFSEAPLAPRPFGFLNAFLRVLDYQKLKNLYCKIAEKINAGGYAFCYAEHCRFTQAPFLLRFLKIPSFYYCHEPPRILYERDLVEKEKRNFVKNILYSPGEAYQRIALKKIDFKNTRSATKILVNSQYSQTIIERIYHRQARVCYHGIDSQVFKPLGTKKEDSVIGVGALHKHKSWDFIVRSLACLPKNLQPDFKIVYDRGSEIFHRSLENLAREKGVKLIFLPKLSDGELLKEYNKARVCVYAPIAEPFGFTPLEAQACGTSVVGVAEGGVKETVFDGQTGFLVSRDEKEFANALEKILTDEKLQKELGKNGREWVLEKWTWNKATEILEQEFL